MLTSYIEDVILITVADLNNYFSIFLKQLTSKKSNDTILLVANEADEKICSLKTKQSRKTSTLIQVTICNKTSCFIATNFL